MKSVLAMLSVALAALVLEEKVRQVAGDAHGAADQAMVQAQEAGRTLTRKVGQQPWLSLLIAGGLAYALATIVPGRQ
jgi:hypothetical protein